jgi:hypothetical protein
MKKRTAYLVVSSLYISVCNLVASSLHISVNSVAPSLNWSCGMGSAHHQNKFGSAIVIYPYEFGSAIVTQLRRFGSIPMEFAVPYLSSVLGDLVAL